MVSVIGSAVAADPGECERQVLPAVAYYWRKLPSIQVGAGQDNRILTFFASGYPPLPEIPVILAKAGIQTPVYPCKQQPARNLQAAGMKTPYVCIVAYEPHGTLYTGGLDSRFRGKDGFVTVGRL